LVKIAAVLNPRAGLAARRALEALRRGRPSWPEIEVRQTTGPGDAQRLAAGFAAQGADTVLAVGGDGTVNEVARGLLGTPAVLGIVPMGSGNGLARGLRLPLQPTRALEALESGLVRRMDVGMANGLPFLNLAGLGFDAAVGADFHAHGGRGGRRGMASYVRLSLKRALAHTPGPVVLETPTAGRFELTPFVVVLANGRQYGSGAWVAPGARLDDGLLEVVIMAHASVLEILRNVPRLFRGTLERSRLYRRVTTPSALIRAQEPFPFHRDGEPEPATSQLEVRLLPRALPILVPREVATDPEGPFLGGD
jgi:diacylglycerol kinase (ATP)